MLKSVCLSLACLLLLAACDRSATSADAAVAQQSGAGQASDGDHMVSVDTPDPVPPPRPRTQAGEAGWPQAELESGQAWISCATDYSREAGDGTLLPALDRASVEAALAPCRETGLVRVRYAGKINAGFAALVWRLASVAEQWKLPHRILDLDSSGGQVEAAIRAGDTIGESNWTIWVREGSICHSACVFVLAAGDNRLVAGKVGIHRMMRISSKATSRAELNRELREVYGNVKDYLERNGVAVAVADLMMTVPTAACACSAWKSCANTGWTAPTPCRTIWNASARCASAAMPSYAARTRFWSPSTRSARARVQTWTRSMPAAWP